MWSLNRLNRALHNRSRFVCPIMFVACAGAVVDSDHVIAYALGTNGRFLHEEFLIFGLVSIALGSIILLSCVSGYLLLRFLRS